MLTPRAFRATATIAFSAILLTFITGVSPAAASTPSRLSGADRFATAVAVSQAFAPGVPVVYVATGYNYPDALSAAPAAAKQGGPLLLTPQDHLPSNVLAEVTRLSPSLIVVVGRAAAVSDDVVMQLSAIAPVRRDGGENRYETSRIINQNAFTSATTAFVATGQNFPDALSASAAAGHFDSPVVLVDGAGSTIDAPTVALLTSLGVTSVKIAGGTGVVSSGIRFGLEDLVGTGNVERLSGANRYETSSAINSSAFSSADTVYFAVGTGYADALAGAALAGQVDSPLFVVPGDCVPAAVLAAMQNLGATHHVLLGGPSVLGSGVENLVDCSTVTPPPPPPPTGPSNPGDSKNCSDFGSQAEAQAWFNTYYPLYGDIANLDQDNDLIACESLP